MGEEVQFLAVSVESTESQDDVHDFSAGLFLKMVEYTSLKKHTKFKEINRTIPKNAKHTSHNIWNEFFDIK